MQSNAASGDIRTSECAGIRRSNPRCARRAVRKRQQGYRLGPSCEDANLADNLADNLNTEAPSRVQDKRLTDRTKRLATVYLYRRRCIRSCEAYPNGGDRVDWIDTATQAAGCLTKSMKPDFIIKVIDAGMYRVSRSKL